MPSTYPNPLFELHRQCQAEFQNWADVEIVQTFGEPQAEYAAIRKSAGLMDLPQRGVFELLGRDCLSFLNNLLTNKTWDKAARVGLADGQGVYAFLLNVRGRVVCDMNVLQQHDRTLLETDVRFVEPLRQVLDKYIFNEQVKTVDRVGQLHEICLHGPRADGILAHLGVAVPPLQRLQSARIDICGIDAVLWRDDPAGVCGLHLIVPGESACELWMTLISRFAAADEPGKRLLRPIGWAAFNAARIEAGRPILGIDFDTAPMVSAAPGGAEEQTVDAPAGALPAETGLFAQAVSLTKGCYLGQEIVARMHSRQQVARQVVGIRMEGDALPIAAAQIFDPQGAAVGVVTSSTISPMLSNAPICLGMVNRPHIAVGSQLTIPAEGAMRRGTVVCLPFVQ